MHSIICQVQLKKQITDIMFEKILFYLTCLIPADASSPDHRLQPDFEHALLISGTCGISLPGEHLSLPEEELIHYFSSIFVYYLRNK